MYEKYQRAMEALEEFKSTNSEYRKLVKAESDVGTDYYRMQREEKTLVTAEYHKLEQLISLHGPTPKVIAKIEEFINKYECYVD